MISHELRCIFVHVPRTAGTSVERVLCGRDWWEVDPETKHLTAAQAAERYVQWFEDYFTFAFVRNPWDRAVSFWKSKYWHRQRKGKRFAEFLRTVGPNPGEPAHAHTQNELLDHPLDFVGRFERLEEDFAAVCERLGLPPERRPKLPKLNTSRHWHYRRYYNDTTRAIVAERYADDIQRWGYRFGA